MNKRGPHFQSNNVDSWPAAVAQMARGAWVKIMDDVNMALTAKQANPNVNVVVRFWRDHMQQFGLDREETRQRVRDFLRSWLNESFLLMSPNIDAVEGFNEYLAVSQNPNEIAARIMWVEEFINIWQNEVLDVFPNLAHIDLCVANTAVGNDIPWQIANLAYQNDYYIGYHGYTSIVSKDYQEMQKFGAPYREDYIRPNFRAANNPMYYPDTHPQWYRPHIGIAPDAYFAIVAGERSPNEEIWGSGRVLQQDIYDYQPRGIYPKYLFTECGLVRDLNGRGWLQPNDGWKHPQVAGGDQNRYLDLEEEVNVYDSIWNANNGGRLHGRVYFTSGANDWPDFDINGSELNYLMASMAQYSNAPNPPQPPPPPPPPPPDPTTVPFANGGFEGEWYHPGGKAEWQIPDKWEFESHTDEENPHDPMPWSEFVDPEVRVLHRSNLPEDERDQFVLQGVQTLKIFKGNGAWYATLEQVFHAQPGVNTFSVNIFADLVKGYENGEKVWADDAQGRDGLLQLAINDTAVDAWISLTPGEWNQASTEITITGTEQVIVSVSATIMCPFALKNSGIFADAWEVNNVPIEQPSYIRGIDSSHWNGQLDAEQCVIAGNDYFIAKATDGWSIVPDAAEPRFDPRYSMNTSAAIAQGLLVGSYHYYQPTRPPAEQAKVFLDHLSTSDAQHLPPILDFEKDPASGQTISQLQAALLTWLAIVEDQTGQLPIIYTNQNYYNLYLNTELFDRFPLWIANYTTANEPAMPNRRDTWEFWQYSYKGGGQHNGVETFDVDQNRWEGTWTDFQSQYGDNWISEPPPPPPVPTNPCEGLPQHARLFNVLPDGLTNETEDKILAQTFKEGQSVGRSYDDAGNTCATDNTAVLWYIPDFQKQIFIDWFQERYPQTVVQFATLMPINKPSTWPVRPVQ